jgi:Spy/CpxP family protein refolding chaperone
MVRSACIALLALLIGIAHPAGAQTPSANRGADRMPDSAGRARLEGEIRRGFAKLLRERVGLSDVQMRQLAPLARGHEQQRRQLQLEERQTRTSLRALLRDPGPDTTRVSALLQTLVDIQKRRVQLVEVEQRDIATVMTPVQRARYVAVQEQIRRRLEQMRHRRAAQSP